MSGSSDEAEVHVRASRLYHQYCAAVDARDVELLRPLLHPEVTITRPGETRHGVEAFLDVYREFNPTCRGPVQHAVSNVLAEELPDGTVETTAYFQATMLDDHETRLVVGRYADTHVVHEGRYVIAHKRNIILGVVTLPAAANRPTNP